MTLEGDDLADLDKLTLTVADEDTLDTVKLSLITQAEDFPATLYIPGEATRARPGIQAYRGPEHPHDNSILTDMTVQAVKDGEVLGEGTITLQG